MTEELTLTDLTVEGVIPPELDGRYVRIGPNPVAADPRAYHFFTGDGMLHGIRIQDGRALWYRNRWIRSGEVAKARDVPAAPGPRHIFDTVNTSVLGHAGSGWALVEAGSTPVRFDEHLEAQRYDDFGGTLPGSFTAHPRRDPATGELHALCYEATDPKRVRYNVVDRRRPGKAIGRDPGGARPADPRLRDHRALRRRHGPAAHPVDAGGAGRARLPYRWNARHPARIGLLPRDGDADDIIWVPLDPCFVFHTANAFDLPDGRVALDVIAYDRMFAGDNLAGPTSNRAGWSAGRSTRQPERSDSAPSIAAPQELPTIDGRRTGLPYRYAYALGLPDEMSETLVGEAPLIKHDLERGVRHLHDFGRAGSRASSCSCRAHRTRQRTTAG